MKELCYSTSPFYSVGYPECAVEISRREATACWSVRGQRALSRPWLDVLRPAQIHGPERPVPADEVPQGILLGMSRLVGKIRLAGHPDDLSSGVELSPPEQSGDSPARIRTHEAMESDHTAAVEHRGCSVKCPESWAETELKTC